MSAAPEPETWHGTLAGYARHGCREQCCAPLGAAYRARRNRERELNGPAYISQTDADQLRERLHQLERRGWTHPEISRATQGRVQGGTIQALAAGRTKRCRPETAEALNTAYQALIKDETHQPNPSAMAQNHRARAR